MTLVKTVEKRDLSDLDVEEVPHSPRNEQIFPLRTRTTCKLKRKEIIEKQSLKRY